jgi:hypothetical protein
MGLELFKQAGTLHHVMLWLATAWRQGGWGWGGCFTATLPWLLSSDSAHRVVAYMLPPL